MRYIKVRIERWRKAKIAYALIAFAILAITSLINALPNQTAYAVNTYSEKELDSIVQKFYAYKIIEVCKTSKDAVFGVNGPLKTYADGQSDSNRCTLDNLNNQIKALGITGDIKRELRIKAGVKTEGDYYVRNCKDKGYTSQTAPDECMGEVYGDEYNGILQNYLNMASGAGNPPEAAWFKIWNSGNAFGKCRSGDFNTRQRGKDDPIEDDLWTFSNGASSADMNKNGGTWKKGSTWVAKNKDGISTLVVNKKYYAYAGSPHLDCFELFNEVNKNFGAYVDNHNRYAENHPDATGDNTTTDSSTTGGSDTGDSEEDPCNAGLLGFGWFMCPGANLLESFINGLLNWVNSSMNWTMLQTNSDIRTKWQTFLNLANIGFAIVFMIMIYSMATSTGLSNYDVKRILPRLIITAIAVNTSFYLCAAMVDVSNIVGKGVYAIFNGDNNTWYISGNKDKSLLDVINEQAGSIIILVVAAFVFLGSAIVAVMTIYAAVTVRQIALAILVVLSPLAIVCYLLPNTQKWYQKWQDYFARLLMVYPMFMAVWGASHWLSDSMIADQAASATTAYSGSGLVGALGVAGSPGLVVQSILTTSSKVSTEEGSDITGMPGFVIQSVLVSAPAFAIIPLFKATGGIMAAATGMAASGLAKTGMANAINKTSRGVAKNNPATRGARHLVGLGAGALATNTKRGSFLNRNLRKAENWGKSADAWKETETQALDAKSMESAKAKVADLTSSQRLQAARDGEYTKLDKRGNVVRDRDGKPQMVKVDQWQQRAAMDSVGDNLTTEDGKTMLINTEMRAQELERNGRAREASELRESAAKAVSASKNAMITGGEITSFKNGGWKNYARKDSNGNYDATATRNALNAHYSEAVAQNVSDASLKTIAGWSGAQRGHAEAELSAAMTNTSSQTYDTQSETMVDNSQANRNEWAGASDKWQGAVSHWQDSAQRINHDDKLQQSMSGSSQQFYQNAVNPADDMQQQYQTAINNGDTGKANQIANNALNEMERMELNKTTDVDNKKYQAMSNIAEHYSSPNKAAEFKPVQVGFKVQSTTVQPENIQVTKNNGAK